MAITKPRDIPLAGTDCGHEKEVVLIGNTRLYYCERCNRVFNHLGEEVHAGVIAKEPD